MVTPVSARWLGGSTEPAPRPSAAGDRDLLQQVGRELVRRADRRRVRLSEEDRAVRINLGARGRKDMEANVTEGSVAGWWGPGRAGCPWAWARWWSIWDR